MDNEKLRFYAITNYWKDKVTKRFMKKEYIVACQNEEAARKIATEKENTISTSDSISDVHSTIYDRGYIQNNRILYKSPPMEERTSLDSNTDTEHINILIYFALLWGSEIGWRHARRPETDEEKNDMIRLRDNKDIPKIITTWANEFITSDKTNQIDFFYDKLKAYLNSNALTILDVTPTDDTEYGRIIGHANFQAEELIKEAEETNKQSKIYLDEIKKILDMSKSSTQQTAEEYNMIKDIYIMLNSGEFSINQDILNNINQSNETQNTIETYENESEDNIIEDDATQNDLPEDINNEKPTINDNTNIEQNDNIEDTNLTNSLLSQIPDATEENYMQRLLSEDSKALLQTLYEFTDDEAYIELTVSEGGTKYETDIPAGIECLLQKELDRLETIGRNFEDTNADENNDNIEEALPWNKNLNPLAHNSNWNKNRTILNFIDTFVKLKNRDDISSLEYFYEKFMTNRNRFTDTESV